MKLPLILLAATLALPAAAGATGCEDVKAQIAAKLDAKGVKNYTLEAVDAAAVKDEKVVGTCEAGTRKIIYKRAG